MKQTKRPSNAHQKSVDRIAEINPVQQSLPPQRPLSAPPQKITEVINDGSQVVLTESNQYLPSFIDKTTSLITLCDSETLNSMKGIHELRQKLSNMLTCLKNMANMPNKSHNKGTYKLLTSSSDICDQIRSQIETYNKTDMFTRIFKEGPIRKKLKQLQDLLNTNVNLIELNVTQSNQVSYSNFNIAIGQSNSMLMPGEVANQSILRQELSPGDSFALEFGQNQLLAAQYQQWTKKLAEVQEKIDTFNKPQIPPPHNVQQTLANDDQRKEKQRRQKEKRQKDEQSKDPSASQAMEADQQKQQRQKGEQLCIQADKLFFGFGSQPNKEAAISHYEESASLGCSKAMLALAAIYEVSDPQKSYEYYDLASDDEPYALFKLGEFMEKMNFQDHQLYALQTYKKSAQQDGGCREALFKLGEFSHKGINMEKNIGQAVRKYEEAAAEGHSLAMNALGSLFYNDLKDHKQAAEWFRKASEKGCARSLNNMATCFEFGHGVSVDRDQAYQLYKESANKGNTQAMLNLAYLTNENARLGKNQDQFKESAFWFRKLTILDPERPQPYFQLAQMHEHGLGCVVDLKSAFQYYRKAARLDHVEALTKCGDFIYSGRGLDCKVGSGDRIEAMKCYRRAADMGSSRAMNSLALMLEAQSNDTEALFFYKMSHKLGNLDATINMALLFLKGCSTEANQNDLQVARTLLAYAFHQGAAVAGHILVQHRLQSSTTGIVWDNEDQEILAAIETAPSQVFKQESKNSLQKLNSRKESKDLSQGSSLQNPLTNRIKQSKDLSQGSSLQNPLTYSMQQSWLRN